MLFIKSVIFFSANPFILMSPKETHRFLIKRKSNTKTTTRTYTSSHWGKFHFRKKNRPIAPKNKVALICAIFPKKFKKTAFLACFLLKKSVFAPYSPILKGVIIDEVCAIKTCWVLSKRELFFSLLAKTCHFRISKNQFKKESNKSSVIFWTWNREEERKNSFKPATIKTSWEYSLW